MRINLKFTTKGQTAIEKFENSELIEIFSRYSNTLTKKYMVVASVPADINQNIAVAGAVTMELENVECDVDIFLRELGRDIRVPLKKRYEGKLDNMFKTEIIEQ